MKIDFDPHFLDDTTCQDTDIGHRGTSPVESDDVCRACGEVYCDCYEQEVDERWHEYYISRGI